MADTTCTCAQISVGNRGQHPTARNLDHDCPEHGADASLEPAAAMDPVKFARGPLPLNYRIAAMRDMLRAECERPTVRKSRVRDVATALSLLAREARRG